MFIKSLNLNLKLCSEKLAVSLLLLLFGLILFLYLKGSVAELVVRGAFTAVLFIIALHQMMKGFGQLYIGSLSGDEAHTIMALPLPAKKMAAGKIIAGGLWMAAFSGGIALLLVLLQNGISFWGFYTTLNNFVDYLTIRGNSPLDVGVIFFLTPVCGLLSALAVSAMFLAISLAAGDKSGVRYGLYLLLLGAVLGSPFVLIWLFWQFGWKYSMLLVLVSYIIIVLCVGGLLYRYACRYLERRYDLRGEKRSLDLR